MQGLCGGVQGRDGGSLADGLHPTHLALHPINTLPVGGTERNGVGCVLTSPTGRVNPTCICLQLRKLGAGQSQSPYKNSGTDVSCGKGKLSVGVGGSRYLVELIAQDFDIQLIQRVFGHTVLKERG